MLTLIIIKYLSYFNFLIKKIQKDLRAASMGFNNTKNLLINVSKAKDQYNS